MTPHPTVVLVVLMEVLWAIAAACPSAVLETYCHPDLARPRFAEIDRQLIEIHCNAPRSICIERFLARISERHPSHREHVHPLAEISAAVDRRAA